jgi:hypothetical protein
MNEASLLGDKRVLYIGAKAKIHFIIRDKDVLYFLGKAQYRIKDLEIS